MKYLNLIIVCTLFLSACDDTETIRIKKGDKEIIIKESKEKQQKRKQEQQARFEARQKANCAALSEKVRSTKSRCQKYEKEFEKEKK